MRTEQDFIASQEQWREERIPVSELERKELIEDVTLFSKEDQLLVRQHLAGTLARMNESRFYKARNSWWENKYGFSYLEGPGREEVLRRKYSSREALSETAKLQDELLSAAESGNEQDLQRLRRKYKENYPEQLEGVESLFGFIPFTQNKENLKSIDSRIESAGTDEARSEAKRQAWPEIKDNLKNITEYRFLVTHFVEFNTDDRDLLRRFWDVMEDIGRQRGNEALRSAQTFRRATLSQIAVMKLFKAIGERPVLSHPSQDALNSIDLWARVGDEERPVQIKGAWEDQLHAETGSTSPLIMETDEIAFPGIEAHGGGKTGHYNSKLFADAEKYRLKVDKYGKEIGKDLLGYFVAIPYEKIDFVTGEPAPELIEAFRAKLAPSVAEKNAA